MLSLIRPTFHLFIVLPCRKPSTLGRNGWGGVGAGKRVDRDGALSKRKIRHEEAWLDIKYLFRLSVFRITRLPISLGHSNHASALFVRSLPPSDISFTDVYLPSVPRDYMWPPWSPGIDAWLYSTWVACLHSPVQGLFAQLGPTY